MKLILKNKSIKSIVKEFIIIFIIGFLIQSCSSDNSLIDEYETNSTMSLEKINTIQSTNLQVVFDTIFQVVNKKEIVDNIYLKVCDDLVTDINTKPNEKMSINSKSFPRLKSVNPETVAAGWTYLGNVPNNPITGATAAIKLYNKCKNEWYYPCLEMRLETEEKVINVYARKCQ